MSEQCIRNISLSEKEIERDKRETYSAIIERQKGINLFSKLMAINMKEIFHQ